MPATQTRQDNKIHVPHIRAILDNGLQAYGYKLDGADLDALTAKYIVHSATVFGTDRLDSGALDFAAEYLYGKAGSTRLDAGETMIVAAAGMLESRLAPQNILRGAAKARDIMTVTSEVDRGANTWSYETYDHTGMAQLVENYSDDIESVTTFASLVTGKVLTYAKSYEWTWEDMNRESRLHKPLRNAKADAVREAFERRLDRVGALGHDGTDVTGLLNNPNITPTNATAAAAGGNAPEWDGADKTNAEILQDLVDFWTTGRTNSLDLHDFDTVVFPLSHWLIVSTRHLYNMDDGPGDNPTIWEAFVRLTNKQWKVHTWFFCATADASGGERLCMFDSRYAPELEVPVNPEDLPPQAKALAVVVNTVGKMAGVRIRYPLAVLYGDNI